MIGIYGADGFIGRHLLSRLAGANLPLRAVSRKFEKSSVSELRGIVEFVEANLHDQLAMASSLQGVDTVVQLISSSSPGLENQLNVVDIQDNVIPHVAFIRSAIEAGVQKYVFLSSGGTVYGPGALTPISENAPTNPISSHGLTKLTIEKYLQMHGHVDGLKYLILRVSNPFGPGQSFRKGQGLIPAVLEHYARGQPARIFGDGKAMRDYIFIDDLIDAIEIAAIHDDIGSDIINIGSGVPKSVLEVIETIEEVFDINIFKNFIKKRNTDVDINYLNTEKAKRVLNWQCKTEFRAGLESMRSTLGRSV